MLVVVRVFVVVYTAVIRLLYEYFISDDTIVSFKCSCFRILPVDVQPVSTLRVRKRTNGNQNKRDVFEQHESLWAMTELDCQKVLNR